MKRLGRDKYGIRIAQKPDVDEFVHISKTGERTYIPNAIEYGHAAPNDAGGIKVAAPIPFMRQAADRMFPKAEQKFYQVTTAELKKV